MNSKSLLDRLNPIRDFFSFVTLNLKHLSKKALFIIISISFAVFLMSMYIYDQNIDKIYVDIFNSFANGLGVLLFALSFLVGYTVYQKSISKRIRPNLILRSRAREINSSAIQRSIRPLTIGDKISTSDIKQIEDNLRELARNTQSIVDELINENDKIINYVNDLTKK